MLPVLSPAEAAALDRVSEARGIRPDDLMEAAGRAVARATVAAAGGSYGRRAVAVCGKGNNGGDGLVAVRLLGRRGMGAVAVMASDPAALSGPAARSFHRFAAAGGRVVRLEGDALARELRRADVAVDALFGTGFRGAAEGAAAAAIEGLNAFAGPVVAADVPSGVDGATGAVAGPAVRAAVTVTFGAMKPGLLFQPGAAHAGRIEVADIGFPPELVTGDLWLVQPSDVAGWLAPRPASAHKRSTGVVLIVAGSRAMTGAAVLTAMAAYRAGAGLVTLAAPPAVVEVAQRHLVEAVHLPLPQTEDGTVAEAGWEAVAERLGSVHAAAIGPGLTTNASTVAFVRRFVAGAPVPFVLDADGLNAFAASPEGLARRRAPAVLTPHAGEFARLAGGTAAEAEADRAAAARRAAAAFDCALLLKGPATVVAEPSGRAFVNPTGGPSLATGGTGDVLTGTVAAFLARGLEPGPAAAAAAFVQGLAGDLAGEELGEGTTASDVAARLPAALAAVREACGT